MILKEPWEPIEFTISAMKFPVYTTNKLTGKKVIKKDDTNRQLFSEKIVSKERPRFSKRGQTFTAPNTVAFEKHIRKCYFEKYPSNNGVMNGGKIEPVGTQYLGCKLFSEQKPCTNFLATKDFAVCKKCVQRRKNLAVDLTVYLTDSRHLDLDNILKIVLDGLEHCFFYNDSQFALKKIALVPYAETERIECKFSALPVEFSQGSLKNNYAIKSLVREQAIEYVKDICSYYIPDKETEFSQYLIRINSRKFIKETFFNFMKDNLHDKTNNIS